MTNEIAATVIKSVEEQGLKEKLRATFLENIAAIEAAIASNTQGSMVYVFPKYGLGVKLDGDKCRVVRMDMATINPPRRNITNGVGLKAVLQSRSVALQYALESAKRALNTLEAV